MTYVHYVAILTFAICTACSGSDVSALRECINGVSLVVLSCDVRDGLWVLRSCPCSWRLSELGGLSFDRPCIMEIKKKLTITTLC